MHVRRSTPNYNTVRGTLASTRLGRPVRYDSLLERDFFLVLDLHPAVESYQEQPIHLPWWSDEGIERVYVPDVLVRFRRNAGRFLGRRVSLPWLVEAKDHDDLGKNWNRLRTK